MLEQTEDPRWIDAANWAAASGFGVGAIAEREGVTRIDALLAIVEQWRRTPELFTRPPAVVEPVGVAQCPECGIWFSDVAAHRGVHENAQTARTPRRPRSANPAVRSSLRAAGPRGADGRVPRAVARGLPLTELPVEAPWRTWAEAANWAAAHGAGPSRLADRIGTDAASVTVAIIDAWSRDPSGFTVPGPVGTPPGALKQCPACGLWFASVDNHVAAHGRISGRRRAGRRGGREWDAQADHDGHAAPRTEFEQAMESAALLDAFLELRRAVADHHSPAQFRARIGVEACRALELTNRIADADGFAAALGELLLSRDGHLEDDGDRVQCHVCGLWAAMLSPHVGVHDLAVREYRSRFGLDPGDVLASRGMRPARPAIGLVGPPS